MGQDLAAGEEATDLFGLEHFEMVAVHHFGMCIGGFGEEGCSIAGPLDQMEVDIDPAGVAVGARWTAADTAH